MNIGITVTGRDGSIGVNKAYLEYISMAGYVPFVITPYSNIEEAAALCEGLVLPGGVDLEPTFYDENNLASRNVDPQRDNFERMVMATFIDAGKKIFGICRGFQLMVRAYLFEYVPKGMFFYQHINGHSLTAERGIARDVPSHSVLANINALYGEAEVEVANVYVNSIHHQALVATSKALYNKQNNGDYIKALATTTFGIKNANDVIVEAVDIQLRGASLRGVQWHPEELKDTALLQNFFNAQVHKHDEGKMVG